jgi:hypothetical protein
MAAPPKTVSPTTATPAAIHFLICFILLFL